MLRIQICEVGSSRVKDSVKHLLFGPGRIHILLELRGGKPLDYTKLDNGRLRKDARLSVSWGTQVKAIVMVEFELTTKVIDKRIYLFILGKAER